MSESIAEVLTYAVGVAISPVPIIAVILMLFSARAKVNGPMFLAGWAVAIGAVSALAYVSSTPATPSLATRSVVLASITILVPVVYDLVGGAAAKVALDSTEEWLAALNAAVMTVLFLFFGVKLIAEGPPVLGG